MQKLIVCAVSASLALLSAHTVAEAKGPKGSSGQGTSIHGASDSAKGQALGSNSWGGGAPGWGNDGSRKGWDNSQPTPQPPGWTRDTTGQDHRWGGNDTAPGLAKR